MISFFSSVVIISTSSVGNGNLVFKTPNFYEEKEKKPPGLLVLEVNSYLLLGKDETF